MEERKKKASSHQTKFYFNPKIAHETIISFINSVVLIAERVKKCERKRSESLKKYTTRVSDTFLNNKVCLTVLEEYGFNCLMQDADIKTRVATILFENSEKLIVTLKGQTPLINSEQKKFVKLYDQLVEEHRQLVKKAQLFSKKLEVQRKKKEDAARKYIRKSDSMKLLGVLDRKVVRYNEEDVLFKERMKDCGDKESELFKIVSKYVCSMVEPFRNGTKINQGRILSSSSGSYCFPRMVPVWVGNIFPDGKIFGSETRFAECLTRIVHPEVMNMRKQEWCSVMGRLLGPPLNNVKEYMKKQHTVERKHKRTLSWKHFSSELKKLSQEEFLALRLADFTREYPVFQEQEKVTWFLNPPTSDSAKQNLSSGVVNNASFSGKDISRPFKDENVPLPRPVAQDVSTTKSGSILKHYPNEAQTLTKKRKEPGLMGVTRENNMDSSSQKKSVSDIFNIVKETKKEEVESENRESKSGVDGSATKKTGSDSKKCDNASASSKSKIFPPAKRGKSPIAFVRRVFTSLYHGSRANKERDLGEQATCNEQTQRIRTENTVNEKTKHLETRKTSSEKSHSVESCPLSSADFTNTKKRSTGHRHTADWWLADEADTCQKKHLSANKTEAVDSEPPVKSRKKRKSIRLANESANDKTRVQNENKDLSVPWSQTESVNDIKNNSPCTVSTITRETPPDLYDSRISKSVDSVKVTSTSTTVLTQSNNDPSKKSELQFVSKDLERNHFDTSDILTQTNDSHKTKKVRRVKSESRKSFALPESANVQMTQSSLKQSTERFDDPPPKLTSCQETSKAANRAGALALSEQNEFAVRVGIKAQRPLRSRSMKEKRNSGSSNLDEQHHGIYEDRRGERDSQFISSESHKSNPIRPSKTFTEHKSNYAQGQLLTEKRKTSSLIKSNAPNNPDNVVGECSNVSLLASDELSSCHKSATNAKLNRASDSKIQYVNGNIKCAKNQRIYFVKNEEDGLNKSVKPGERSNSLTVEIKPKRHVEGTVEDLGDKHDHLISKHPEKVDSSCDNSPQARKSNPRSTGKPPRRTMSRKQDRPSPNHTTKKNNEIARVNRELDGLEYKSREQNKSIINHKGSEHGRQSIVSKNVEEDKTNDDKCLNEANLNSDKATYIRQLLTCSRMQYNAGENRAQAVNIAHEQVRNNVRTPYNRPIELQSGERNQCESEISEKSEVVEEVKRQITLAGYHSIRRTPVFRDIYRLVKRDVCGNMARKNKNGKNDQRKLCTIVEATNFCEQPTNVKNGKQLRVFSTSQESSTSERPYFESYSPEPIVIPDPSGLSTSTGDILASLNDSNSDISSSVFDDSDNDPTYSVRAGESFSQTITETLEESTEKDAFRSKPPHRRLLFEPERKKTCVPEFNGPYKSSNMGSNSITAIHEKLKNHHSQMKNVPDWQRRQPEEIHSRKNSGIGCAHEQSYMQENAVFAKRVVHSFDGHRAPKTDEHLSNLNEQTNSRHSVYEPRDEGHSLSDSFSEIVQTSLFHTKSPPKRFSNIIPSGFVEKEASSDSFSFRYFDPVSKYQIQETSPEMGVKRRRRSSGNEPGALEKRSVCECVNKEIRVQDSNYECILSGDGQQQAHNTSTDATRETFPLLNCIERGGHFVHERAIANPNKVIDEKELLFRKYDYESDTSEYLESSISSDESSYQCSATPYSQTEKKEQPGWHKEVVASKRAELIPITASECGIDECLQSNCMNYFNIGKVTNIIYHNHVYVTGNTKKEPLTRGVSYQKK